ncbi:MAG: hypothetical protein M1426_04805 [Patescibacteria group bacterium]|nr:hypothetical protein [Patescibacteria group bacterium]
MTAKRYSNNPVISPNKNNPWEKEGSFNCSVVEDNGKYIFLYRAISSLQNWQGTQMNVSTIGYADSTDGLNIENRKQLISPENIWEKYGCEDPRVTKLDDTFYIFYTAISTWPPNPAGIKVAVAKTKDFKTFEKHLVTPFNAKAMALFPEKINGKIYGVLTVDTDNPPSKISIVEFSEESQIWEGDYWNKWHDTLTKHVLPLRRDRKDQVEVGSAPIKTDRGWLVFYCYIQNYLSNPKTFGIEAVLLDLENPLSIIKRTNTPILVPREPYELYGSVPNVIFPSGAVLKDNKVSIYYGAADTSCCVAEISLQELLEDMETSDSPLDDRKNTFSLSPFEGNPIMNPIEEHPWETKAVFNSAAVFINDKIHLIYRALSNDDTSVFGYASSKDGFHIDERLEGPVYTPREPFEEKKAQGGSGCEDPRISVIDNKIYMLYTAYNGYVPHVALTSLSIDNFLNHTWEWEKPVLISPPDVPDKDACILSEKINNQYMIFHRIEPGIWIDFVDDFNFTNKKWIEGKELFGPREGKWDSIKVGIGAPPIKSPLGWLLIYHGISKDDDRYRLGLAVLDLEDPSKVILRLDDPILEPTASYSMQGIRPGAVFTCGAIIKDNILFVYYGAGDKVLCVSRINYNSLLENIKSKLRP